MCLVKIAFDGFDAPPPPIDEVVDVVVTAAAVEVTTLFGERHRIEHAVIHRIDLTNNVVRLARSVRP